MDKPDNNLDSLLRRRKQLQSIMDSHQKTIRRTSQPTVQPSKEEDSNGMEIEENNEAEIKPCKRKRHNTLSNSNDSDTSIISCTPEASPVKLQKTWASNKKINIISVYSKLKDAKSFIMLPDPNTPVPSLSLLTPTMTSSIVPSSISCLEKNEAYDTYLHSTEDPLLASPATAPLISSTPCLEKNETYDTHLHRADDPELVFPAIAPLINSTPCLEKNETYDTRADDPELVFPATAPLINLTPCLEKNETYDTRADDPELVFPATAPLISSTSCLEKNETYDTRADDPELVFPATAPLISSTPCLEKNETYDTHLHPADDSLLAPTATVPLISSTSSREKNDTCATHLHPAKDPLLASPATTPMLSSPPCLKKNFNDDTHHNTHLHDAEDPLLASPPTTPLFGSTPCLKQQDNDDIHPHPYKELLLATTSTAPLLSSTFCLSNNETRLHSTQDPLFVSTSTTDPLLSTTHSLEQNENDDNHLHLDEDPLHESQKTDARKRRRSLKKSYIDFLSDTEENPFSADSSDYWAGSDEHGYSSDDGKNKNKRKKKKKTVQKENIKDIAIKRVKPVNKYKINKKLREAGLPYKNRRGEMKESKPMQTNPCIPDKCKRKCFDISEERRRNLHSFFWSLDIQRRKDWILRCSRAVPVDRKRTDSPNSRRNLTYEYFINDGDDHKKVCQKFILNTLGITQKYLLYTISHAKGGIAILDQRNRHAPPKFSESTKHNVKEFINKLPVVPSHYTRRNTTRVYLSQDLKNIANLYKIYVNDCTKKEIEVVSERVFRDIFRDDYNHVSFHMPKKDKCVLCIRDQKDMNEEEKERFNIHILEKEAMSRRFAVHQDLHTINNDTITASFDLQKVLNTPHGESMLLYYSRKYTVYNFTVYESGTQEGYCFTWGESEGKRGSNEIATCLFQYLKSVDEKGYKNLLLYCDSCGGQNKNKTVLAALNYFLMFSQNLQVIQINFLLPKHTYMPADSMHATIEREVRKLIVWSPSQWATYFESARKRPRPYKVTVMDHKDFLNWEEIAVKTFTKESLKQFKYRDLKIATFKKKTLDQMEYKCSMREGTESHTLQLFEETKRKGKGKGKGKRTNRNVELSAENMERHKGVMVSNLQPLYTSSLPIATAKYNDLKRLCENGSIPKRFHAEYSQLPYKSQIVETLPQTDEEDEVESDQ